MSCAVLMRAMLPFQPLTWVCINSSSQDDSIEFEWKTCFLCDVHRLLVVENHPDRLNEDHTRFRVRAATNAQH